MDVGYIFHPPTSAVYLLYTFVAVCTLHVYFCMDFNLFGNLNSAKNIFLNGTRNFACFACVFVKIDVFQILKVNLMKVA